MKPNPIRAVLEELSKKANITEITSQGKWVNQDICEALESIARIVEGEKKCCFKHKEDIPMLSECKTCEVCDYKNEAITEIAKLIRGKE